MEGFAWVGQVKLRAKAGPSVRSLQRGWWLAEQGNGRDRIPLATKQMQLETRMLSDVSQTDTERQELRVLSDLWELVCIKA